MSGKHSNNNTKQSTKSNNMWKVLLVIFIIIAIIVAVLYYKKYNTKPAEVQTETKEQQIEEIFNNAFTNLKNLNKTNVKEYIDYDALVSSVDKMIIEDNNNDDTLEKELFENLEWQIDDIFNDENKAIVKVKTSNIDFKNIVTTWMKSVVSEKSKGTNISNEFVLNKLQEAVEKENEIRTVTKEITLIKKDENWIFSVDTNLRNAVFTGIEIINTALTK